MRVLSLRSAALLTCVALANQNCTSRFYNEGAELRLPAAAPLTLATTRDQVTKNSAGQEADSNSTEEGSVSLGQSESVTSEVKGKPQDLYTNSDVLVVDEDSIDNENDAPDEEITLEEDSEKSPEELSQIVPDAGFKIEGDFPLCEGSIYLTEWTRDFEYRWNKENAARFKHKKKSRMRRALQEAKSQAFLKLLFPALGVLEFDYPVVITEDVLKWMQYFQTRGRSVFVTWLRRAEDVAPQMRTVLESYGLPRDLVYLSMIESGFNNRATSIVRAAGPWQFMRSTGRLYGLRVDDYIDERRDPEKSTRAAAEYLTALYTMFGDWHLASASYNAGEGRIVRAMRGEEQTDFFTLSEAKRLPNETRNYVPKIIAAMIIAKNPSRFGFDVTDGSRAIPSKKISLDRSIVLADLAKVTNVDLKVLEGMNPELRLGITPPPKENTTYELRVPESVFGKASESIASLPPAPTFHRVVTRAPRRETVASLTHRYRLSLHEFLKANPGLRSSTRLRRGQVISMPVKLGSGQFERLSADREPSKRKRRKHRHYRVKRTAVRSTRKVR